MGNAVVVAVVAVVLPAGVLARGSVWAKGAATASLMGVVKR
jgi:hypothetical protein